MIDLDSNIEHLEKDIIDGLNKLQYLKNEQDIYLLCSYLDELILIHKTKCRDNKYLDILYQNSLFKSVYFNQEILNFKNNENNIISNKQFLHDLAKDLRDEIFRHIEFSDKEEITYLEDIDYLKTILKFIEENHSEHYITVSNILNSVYITKRIYDELDYEGICIADFLNKKSYTFLKELTNKVKTMVHLVHELGHAVENQHIFYDIPKNKYIDIISKNSLYEINSSLYEYDFSKYLSLKKEFSKSSKNYIYNFYFSIYSDFNDLSLLTTLPNELLYQNEYQHLSKEDFFNSLVQGGNKTLNIYELDEAYSYDFYSSLIYGIGRAFAIYLSNLLDNDKEKYKFVNERLNKAKLEHLDSTIFNKLGIRKEEFIDTIKQEIKDTNKKQELVKKYTKI